MAVPNDCPSQTSGSGGGAAATGSSVRDWVGRIIGELQKPVSVNGGDAHATATIFRVPIPIREVAIESYIPQFFAFGLYGHDTIKDHDHKDRSRLDSYRVDFAKIFMTITGKSWDEVVDVVEANGDSVEDWVNLYGDYKLESDRSCTDPKLSKTEIQNLLALDSVFIACVIQAYHQHVCHHPGCQLALNPLNQETKKVGFTPLLHLIILDIFKFENQIPLRLLEKYVKMMFEGTDISAVKPDLFTMFLINAVDLIYCDLPGHRVPRSERFSPRKISEGLKQCKHLLHCLYLVVCYKPDPMEEGPAGTCESMWSRIMECLNSEPNTGDGPTSAQSQPGDVELSRVPDGRTAIGILPTGLDGVAAEEPATGAQGSAPPGPGACNDQGVVPRGAPQIQPERESHFVDLGARWRATHPQLSTGDGDDTAAEESAPGDDTAAEGTAPGPEEPAAPPGNSASNLVMQQLTSILKACWTFIFKVLTASWTFIFKVLTASWTFIFKVRPKPHSPVIHIPTVTQLKEAGIRVAVGDTKWIADVHFKRSWLNQGTLYIPAFSVYDETEVLLRNLLTFEYVVETKRDLRSYVHLMDNLINTEEDVKLMRESRVLKNNSLGSDELLANMLNKMLFGIVIKLSKDYLSMFHRIMDHYDNSFNKLTGEFFGLYFRRKPWLFIGGGLVLATAVATILSTVYTILTYKITDP